MADDAELDETIEELRTAAERFDPPPPNLVPMALAGYDLTGADEALAALVEDSAAEGALAGVRSGSEARVMTFAGGDLHLEVEIQGTPPSVSGSVEPAGDGVVSFVGLDDRVVVGLDDLGRFRADLRTSSPFRIVVIAPSDQVILTTPWVLP